MRTHAKDAMTRHLMLVLAVLCLVPAPALAAQRAPCPAADSAGPFLPCQVDSIPVAIDRQGPQYPSVPRSNHLSGSARVQYVVDTTGRVDQASFRIVHSTEELFGRAVRANWPRWRFTPAISKGGRVRVRLEEEFVFSMPASAPPVVFDIRNDTTPDGLPRTTIGWPLQDTIGAKALGESELLDAQRAVLALLAGDPLTVSAQTGPTLCVQLQRDGQSMDADAETLRRLSTQGRAAVIPADCPRTYANMFAVLDSLGRPERAPPGWLDPYRISITQVEPWSRDVVFTRADFRNGTGVSIYRCAAVRAGAGWTGLCSVERSWVS